jgi:hypothetical protein
MWDQGRMCASRRGKWITLSPRRPALNTKPDCTPTHTRTHLVQGVVQLLHRHVGARQVHHGLDADVALHARRDLQGQVRRGAARAPGDVAEQGLQGGHAVLALDEVGHALAMGEGRQVGAARVRQRTGAPMRFFFCARACPPTKTTRAAACGSTGDLPISPPPPRHGQVVWLFRRQDACALGVGGRAHALAPSARTLHVSQSPARSTDFARSPALAPHLLRAGREVLEREKGLAIGHGGLHLFDDFHGCVRGGVCVEEGEGRFFGCVIWARLL